MKTRAKRLQRKGFVWRSYISNPLERTSVRPLPPFLIALGVFTLVSLGLADGEADAAEIDKELISARLKEDVLEHAGKLHLFVADSVSALVVYDDFMLAAPHPHIV